MNGQNKLTLTVKEAAEAIGVSVPYMYSHLLKSEGFPTVKMGKRTLVSAEGLKVWIAEKAKIGWEV